MSLSRIGDTISKASTVSSGGIDDGELVLVGLRLLIWHCGIIESRS